jgi:protein arginine N-methyltransferase 1
MSYSLLDYGKMIGDEVRAESYARAMRQVIRPGDVVLDLGAGTGIFSLLACKLGARQVHACDTNPAIQVARELARGNGFADRITCHEGRSDKLTLPEPVDVIVSDLRGVLPLHGRHLPTLIDARMRHLKPGGMLLPRKDQLWVALAEAADEHQRAVTPWNKNGFGFDLGPWSSLLCNAWGSAQPVAAQIASSPVPWFEINYRTVATPDVRGRVTCVASREAVVHGFFLWFDATIADGVTFSGGPDAAKLPYGCGFFPWPRPVTVKSGDRVEIDIDATLVGDDYTWTWRTRHGETRFAQSTFLGASLSPKTLRKCAAGHVPELNEDGKVTLRALEGLGQRRPLGQIAETLLAEFPGRFASQAECLGFVGSLSGKYSL